ncbi:MAG: hypothetical protein KDA71_08220, partial [Planctomycetales bacterium]|nr:hypothetical protein [Planctomycetales bacterium]
MSVIVVSFSVLGYFGVELYRQAPPIPSEVATPNGEVVYRAADIRDGQNVWQSIGGQELGSIWGHGAYVAPDWSADWLHRECMWLLNHWSRQQYESPFEQLTLIQQAELRARLKQEVRTNGYDPDTDRLVISADRAEAADALGRYYAALFGDAAEFPEDIQWLADG